MLALRLRHSVVIGVWYRCGALPTNAPGAAQASEHDLSLIWLNNQSDTRPPWPSKLLGPGAAEGTRVMPGAELFLDGLD